MVLDSTLDCQPLQEHATAASACCDGRSISDNTLLTAALTAQMSYENGGEGVL